MTRFVTDDGVALHYAVGGDDRSPDPPVVLAHGFCSSIELNWERPGLLSALGAAGRRTLAIDARGHGRSEGPHDLAAYGEARMAADLLALTRSAGVERFDLVGYSMGSVVALLAAATDPARVRRLVIGGVGAAVAETGGVGPRAIPPRLAEALRAGDPAAFPAGSREREWREWVDAHGGDRLALAAQAEAMHATPITLRRVRMPARLIVGTGDTEAGERPRVLADALPDCELVLLDGTHMDLFERAAYADAVISFLAG